MAVIDIGFDCTGLGRWPVVNIGQKLKKFLLLAFLNHWTGGLFWSGKFYIKLVVCIGMEVCHV